MWIKAAVSRKKIIAERKSWRESSNKKFDGWTRDDWFELEIIEFANRLSYIQILKMAELAFFSVIQKMLNYG